MTGGARLRVVEIGGDVAAGACGRLFAALGHDVVLVEPPKGHPLRRLPPLNRAGEGLTFVALHADKSSVVAAPDTAEGRETITELVDGADVLIVGLDPGRAGALGLDAPRLRQRWPDLVAVLVTGFADDGDLPPDSLLAESYGGLATMIGEPGRRPLGLGGEQAAYCSGIAGFLGAMLALRTRDAGGGGDVIDVAMCDVAAYMDWKSDVGYAMTGSPPKRTGATTGDWRIVRARDGWVGFIFQPKHWDAVVELVGAPELRDPALADPAVRLARPDTWWPVVERWASRHGAEQIYQRAQRLGLPFGWTARASDLVASAQLRARGFVGAQRDTDGSVPVVGTPLHTDVLDWLSGPPPALGSGRVTPRRRAATARPAPQPPPGAPPLAGITVLDFGTITAGAAVTRLLADYGATVLKIEWLDSPDTFRSWKMPTFGADGRTVVDAPPSPFFASNNVGKRGVGINLKTPEGQRLVRELARRSHVLVENYRVGVTRRLGIDVESLHAVNPDLIYVSLSSQGQKGPEAGNSSYGSTLDLLSGLASVTGYGPDGPLWSSSDVNYPDQLVSLFAAGFVAYCLQQGVTGAYLDMSQREVVSWTLAAEIADYLVNGRDTHPQGNRRPGRAPHDTYPCREPDTWIALSCASDDQRRALAGCIGSPGLADRDAAWWHAEQDAVDAEVCAWSRTRTREQAVAELRAAGVPAVPVKDARDRSRDPRFDERRVRRSDLDVPVKGVPFLGASGTPPTGVAAPALGEHTRATLKELCGLSDTTIDELQERGVVYGGATRERHPESTEEPTPGSDRDPDGNEER